jgi:hypothetical protein
MTRLLSGMVVLLVFYSSPAQNINDTTFQGMNENRFRIYKIWISSTNILPLAKREGVLYEIKDSSISVSNSLRREDYYNRNFRLSEIKYADIDVVKTRMKNSILVGALAGGLTGFLAGTVIGIISGDDPPGILSFTAGEKAMVYGSMLAAGCAGIGALEASIKIKIPINGSLEKFKSNRNRLKRYSIR